MIPPTIDGQRACKRPVCAFRHRRTRDAPKGGGFGQTRENAHDELWRGALAMTSWSDSRPRYAKVYARSSTPYSTAVASVRAYE